MHREEEKEKKKRKKETDFHSCRNQWFAVLFGVENEYLHVIYGIGLVLRNAGPNVKNSRISISCWSLEIIARYVEIAGNL